MQNQYNNEDEKPQQPVKRFDIFHNKDDLKFIRDFDKQFGTQGMQAYCERMGWFNKTSQHPRGAYDATYMPQILEAQDIFKALNDLIMYDGFAEKVISERLAETEKML
jgi:hypothetical protein